MSTAGQVRLSITGRPARARVTVTPAWVSAELRVPARATLRSTKAAWAVFQGVNWAALAGASEDAKRCTPDPLNEAWRLRQAWALA